jgi:hypothetical protein
MTNDGSLHSTTGAFTPVASHIASDNVLPSNGHDGTTLENSTLKGFGDEVSSQLQVKREEIETPEDIDHSESSSTTLQGDVVQNEEFQASGDREEKEDISAISDDCEDQELSSAENGNGIRSDNIDTAESEGSEDRSSEVEIFTSPSQRKIIPMSKSSAEFDSGVDEQVSSEAFHSVRETPAQNNTPIHLETDASEFSHNKPDGNKEGSSPPHSSEDSQNVDEPTSSLNEDTSVHISGSSIQIADYTTGRHGRLILTEDEAARVVTTRKIKVRSARYGPSTGATNIPNFYYLSSDDQGSDVEAIASRIRVQNSAMNMVTPAFRMSGAFPYTRVSKSAMYVTATGFQTTLAPNNAIESQESTSSDHSESTHHDPAVSDLQTTAPLPKTNHTSGSSYSDPRPANGTHATVSDIQSNRIAHSGDTHPPPSDDAESTVQRPVTDTTASNLQTIPPFSDGNQTQDSTQFSHTVSVASSAPTVSHTLQVSAHPAADTHSQPVSKQVSHSQHNGAPTAGDSNASFQHTGPSGVPNHVASTSMTSAISQFTAYCTYCRQRTDPSLQTPQVLCSGCGPTSMIRYCSVACLLVDSFAHSTHCMNYAASDRAAFYNLPSTFFVYIQNPIVPEFSYLETPERFRQRAFSMYCSSGPFPKLYQSWMKRPDVILTPQTSLDPNEDFKRTGDYAVFRSDYTLSPPRNNANADVIFT